MIRSWANRDTRAVFEGNYSRRLGPQVSKIGRRKLRMLHAAGTLKDLRVPPANRLEVLRGDRKGQHSIRINDQFRVYFRWHNGDAYDVEITDYH